MLGLGIFCQIGNGFNAKDFNDNVTRCKILIKKILILALSIDDIYFTLVEESFV